MHLQASYRPVPLLRSFYLPNEANETINNSRKNRLWRNSPLNQPRDSPSANPSQPYIAFEFIWVTGCRRNEAFDRKARAQRSSRAEFKVGHVRFG